jgi:hypothetical protein
MRNRSKRVRINSPGSLRAQNIRGLRRCIGDLKALYAEAASILTTLLVKPSAAVARELCARFRLLQAYFSIRYHEAQKLALSAIGSLKLRRSFP